MPDGVSLLSDLIPHGGDVREAFEEFCCQIEAEHPPSGDAEFTRFRGSGGDGGVECIWRLRNGDEHGLQAKFVDSVEKLAKQAKESFSEALAVHPRLVRYTICYPFNPTGPTARSGNSESEKIDELKIQLEELAAVESRDVEIEFLSQTLLLGKLVDCDQSGGRWLFWFGEQPLTHDWFETHLSSAFAHAGPRYSSDFTVEHPVRRVLDALTRSEEWRENVLSLATELDQAPDSISSMNTARDEQNFGSVPGPNRRRVNLVVQRCKRVAQSLRTACKGSGAIDVEAEAKKLQRSASRLRGLLRDHLAATHGENAVDSAQFRQFQAEYQLAFPAAPYDEAKKIEELASRLVAWSSSPEVGPRSNQPLSIIGDAGVGKTHSLCDFAHARHRKGLRSILLFGDRFTDGSECWIAIARMLGLGDINSEAQLLDRLNAAGQATGEPLLIVIDALNESRERYWLSRLRSLAAAVGDREWLCLALTCRSGYEDLIFPDDLSRTRFVHSGFSADPREVTRAFFAYHKLVPPIQPPLPREFGNPLFLKIVCETLVASGATTLEFGWRGLAHIIKTLLDAKGVALWRDRGIRQGLRVIPRSLGALGRKMMEDGTRWVEYTEAVRIVSGVSGTSGEAVVEWLLMEDLLYEDRTVLSAEVDAPQLAVGIAFDRLRDYVVAQAFADECVVENGVWTPGPNLLALLNRGFFVPSETGPLQMLSLLAPDRWGMELADLCEGYSCLSEIRVISIHAMRWRHPDDLGDSAKALLFDALREGEGRTRPIALDTAFHLALEPSALDALALHEHFAAVPMPERDEFLCGSLHFRMEKNTEITQLFDVGVAISSGHVSRGTAYRWLICMMWFFVAADRRVRDRATRTAIELGVAFPELLHDFVEKSLEVDDDYVRERVLATTYGVLLRDQDTASLGAIARLVHGRVLGGMDYPANAIIRDYARCIIDLALRKDAVQPEEVEGYLPPYTSDWPLDIPGEEIKPGDDEGFGLRKVYLSCTFDDFFAYTLGCAEAYNTGLNKTDYGRWVFAEVLRMGYGREQHNNYDGYMVHDFGGGRGRPQWAERIGKKYQVIALNRLLARLADNAETDEEDYFGYSARRSPTSLCAKATRDMDVSVSESRSPFDESGDEDEQDWFTAGYDFAAVSDLDDETWLNTHDDVTNLAEHILQPRFASSDDWYVLNASVGYTLSDRTRRYSRFERRVWLHVRSCLVPNQKFESLWRNSRKMKFHDSVSIPEGYDISEPGFIGEYPWGAVFEGWNGCDREPESPDWIGTNVPLIGTTHSIGWTFDEDCSLSNSRPNVRVPISRMIVGLNWDGGGGFRDAEGRLVFVDPTFGIGGSPALLAQKDHLEAWLASNGFSLFWHVYGEKLPKNYEEVHRLNYDNTFGFHGGRLRKSRRPVVWRDW